MLQNVAAKLMNNDPQNVVTSMPCLRFMVPLRLSCVIVATVAGRVRMEYWEKNLEPRRARGAGLRALATHPQNTLAHSRGRNGAEQADAHLQEQ